MPEDPPQLQAHQRMEEIAERYERQPVVYGIFDDGSLAAITKPVGVPPESVGSTHLLVHEPDRWLPIRDTRQPAQRNPEQAQPVVDEGPLLHRYRVRRDPPEVIAVP